jgi:hypothetical protein
MDPALDALAGRYVRFADEEARGRSPLYDALARGVAEDTQVLDFLSTLPAAKQQPNLLLAAVRHLFGVVTGWEDFRHRLLGNVDAVRAVMLARSTQTNEPGRCAVLLPVLARLPQPLALIEVGASAGLCLLPDLYGYEYGEARLRLRPEAPDHPVFACAAGGATPLPATLPRIAWRAGLDLNPIDATDPEQTDWLETLVWPEQTARLGRLRAALRLAARHRPRIIKGDLLGDALPALCREAPRGATLVVFHTAVLAYVAKPSDRQDFAERVGSLCSCWISNEAPGVFPTIAAQAGPPPLPGRFLLSVNGMPTAWTDAHGTAMEWIGAQNRSAQVGV